MEEAELQRRIRTLLDEERFAEAISGRETVNAALSQSRDDHFWPRYPVDYLSRVRVAEAAEYVLSRLTSLELVTQSKKSLSIAKGEAMYADLLYCSTEYATFVLLELKVDWQTERQAVTELLAYEQEIMNHCPFLGHDDLVFVLIGTAFRTTVDHALAGMMTWSRRKVLCLRAEPDGDSIRLNIHLPRAWSPIGQGILPADAVTTADLCFYPPTDMPCDQLGLIAQTAMDIIVREGDRTGNHGFAMLWEDAMYPKVSHCPIVLTVGIVNPFAFLPAAVRAGIQLPDRTDIQSYLLEGDKHEDLASAHNWAETIGAGAINYLKHWCSPAWEGLSSWHALRVADRVDGPAQLLERRAMPMLFDFFGVMGEHARELTVRTALRTNFLPGTVRPGMDWKHPLFGAALLDSMTLTEVVPMGQWTFGACFELGRRLGRLASIAGTHRGADETTKAKLESRLFWAEVDLWEPLHALQDRYGCTSDISTAPPRIAFGGHAAGRDVGAEVQATARWIADHFIGDRSDLLRTAFGLGLKSHGLYDATFVSGAADGERSALVRDVATVARDLLLASAEHVFSEGMRSDDRTALLHLLEDHLGSGSPDRKSHADVEKAIAGLSDEDLVALLPEGIVPLVDRWCPQLWHALAPAKLTGVDWSWLKQQIAAFSAQGMSQPGIMLWPNAELTTVDFSAHAGALPQVPDPETQVLVSVHPGVAEITVVMTWAELEKDGFSRIEKMISDAVRSKRADREKEGVPPKEPGLEGAGG